jgi:non-canonical poly(A) RNA polymerase PAPD5/7
LLKADHATGSELNFFDTQGGVTYRPLEDLTDSEEADMDISGDEDESSAEPSSKRARLSVEQSASGNSAPKWSNPDPYTVLPPETTTQGKKKDVVQMIRKARVPVKPVKVSLPSEEADFISLDVDSDVSDDTGVAEVPPPAVQAPRGPDKPKPARELYPDPTPSALGSRKRTHDDEIKMPHTKLKKASKAPVGGDIVSEWRAVPGQPSTPWMVADHSQSANVAVWLVSHPCSGLTDG